MRHTLARWSVVPLLLAACSHDATRVNPLDAELTPPVQLTVDLDDTTGVATLSWGAYAGSIPFGEYVVLRQVQGLVAADTLVRLTDVQATAHADSTIRHGASYLYRVLVVNSGGLTVSSESVSSPTLSLRAPRIVTLDASSVTASIYVGWQRFRGPGFQQYRITRDDGVSTQTIHTTSDTTDTSHVDTALRGSTTYRYRVEVETERGLAVGDWAEDGFHQVVDTWHLPVQQVGFNTEQVRLSVGESGWLQAFMTAPSRLVTFDAQGVVRSEQSMPRSAGGGALPSTTVRPDGDRLVLVPGAARPVAAVLLLDDAGNAETTIHDLSEHLADLGITPQDIQGRIGLVGSGGQHYHDIKVTSGLRTLFADDFGSLPIGELAPEDLSGWIFNDSSRDDPVRHNGNGWIRIHRALDGRGVRVERRDPAWQDFLVELNVALEDREVGIEIGGDVGHRIELWLWESDGTDGVARMRWTFSPSDTAVAVADSAFWELPIPIVRSLAYHLQLGFIDGQAVARITDQARWFVPLDDEASWGSMVQIGTSTAFTINNGAYTLNAAGDVTMAGGFASQVSEMRAWQLAGQRVASIGVCLPWENSVTWGTVLSESTWRTGVGRNRLGPRIGEQTRDLFYPRSFAVGPDGRFYVLDSGNHRVVVFDPTGQYITEWGGQGSAPGKFDLGPGGTGPFQSLAYWGSIAVDAEGYVYVADVFNRRIQKFGP